jgi:hypothetical protein
MSYRLLFMGMTRERHQPTGLSRISLRQSRAEGFGLMRLFLLLPYLLLAACGTGGTFNFPKRAPSVKPLTEIEAKLAFTCKNKTIPAPSAESGVLFQYARWLQKNNQLKQGKNVDLEIERLYRIAAENGHYKANINLQNGAMRGRFELSGAQHLRMSQQLIEAGVATGYYFVGIFLQQGSAGLHETLTCLYVTSVKQPMRATLRLSIWLAISWHPATLHLTLLDRCGAVLLSKVMARPPSLLVSIFKERGDTKKRLRHSN